MVQEIHSAQRKREESMMGRMKLNSQEKEEALRRLRELERRLDEYVLFCCPLCNLLIDKFIISRVSHIYYICLALIYLYSLCFRGYSDNTDLSDFDDHDEDEVTEVRGHSSICFFISLTCQFILGIMQF